MKTKKTSTSMADKTSKKQDTFRTFGTNLSDKAMKVVEKLLGDDDDQDAYLDAIIYLYSKMPDANPQYLKIFYSCHYDGTWINTISEEELNILQNELKDVVLYCYHKINQRDRGNYTNSYWWQKYGDRYKSQELKIDVVEQAPDNIDYYIEIEDGVFCTMRPELVELCYKLTNPVPGSTIFLPFAGDSQFATYRDGYRYEGFESNLLRGLLGEILIKICGIDAEIAYYETPQEALSRDCEKRYDYIFTYLPFFDKVYDDVRENLKNQFFDLMAQLNDGGAMCCILPYSVCFSYEWKDFRKRVIENEGQYSAKIIVLPHRNDVGGLECLFVIKKDGQGAISLLDARAEEFLISHSVTHSDPDLSIKMHYTMNVKAVCDAISVGQASFSDIKIFSCMFSDLDEKLGLIPHRYVSKASDGEKEREYGEILGNLIDIVTDNNTDNPKEEDKSSVYSSKYLTLDWFNCDLPERVLDERPWRSKLYRLDRNCLLCVWDGEQFRVGKLRGVNAEQIVYLETGIVPIRIKSDTISEKYLLMSLTSNPTQLIGVNSRGNQLDEEDFLSIGIVVPSKERQEQLCEEALKTRVLDTEQKLQDSEEGHLATIRNTKHAIGQTIFSLNNWWKILQRAREEGNGLLDDAKTVTSKEILVADIYKNIQEKIKQLQKQFEKIDSGDHLVATEINLAEFIDNYTKRNPGLLFKYENENHLSNVRDLVRYPKFSIQALERIFDNIINNAESHGFKNREEENNVVRIELDTEGFDYIIKISNNGHPIPEDFPAEDVFVNAKSTSFGESHSGIGGYDIKRLMQDFGGDVQIVSTPEEEFTVSYKLIFHNVQLNMMKFLEENFRKFDPKIHGSDRFPDVPGNYIVVLRKGSHLPNVGIVPIMKTLTFENVEYEVIYTGISKDSLRSRDYKKHFTGNNAGVSTLRKSLGSLMGMTKTARDKSNPGNGKTKFIESDEVRLSEWMKNNLLLFFRSAPVGEVVELELDLIRDLNPPLNLKDNDNPTNSEFRAKLSELRK